MNETAERTYDVEGMTCAHCELSVSEAIEALAGVENVRADRARGNVIVRGDVDPAAVRSAVERAGYQVAAGLAVTVRPESPGAAG